MSFDLYQTALLRLAADAVGAGRLAQADASLTLDNPLCGDRVTLDITHDREHVIALGHEVKACILCQASATLLGRHSAGKGFPELRQVAAQVERLMKQPDIELPENWTGLDALRPAAAIKSRHACVTLPFRALVGLLDGIE